MGLLNIDIESIFLVLLFIAPGFISVRIKNSLAPRKELTEFKFFVEVVIYTFLNYTILTQFIQYSESFIELKVKVFELSFLAKFWLVAIFTGIVAGLTVKEDLYYKLLGWLKLTKLVGTPTPWDEIFSNDCWAIVTLSSGEIYEGYVKHVSVFPDDKEIYLEKVKILNDDRTEKGKLDTVGIWINPKDIRTIEVSY